MLAGCNFKQSSCHVPHRRRLHHAFPCLCPIEFTIQSYCLSHLSLVPQVVFIQEHSQRLAKEADRQQRLQAVSRSVSNIVA